MKKKELQQIAKKIAAAELIISKSNDNHAKAKAKEEILELSGRVVAFEDIIALDEMIQKILEQS